jgi:hypothetical protein
MQAIVGEHLDTAERPIILAAAGQRRRGLERVMGIEPKPPRGNEHFQERAEQVQGIDWMVFDLFGATDRAAGWDGAWR